MAGETMTAAEYRERIEPRNEQVFTDMVLQLLRANGWMAYHTFNSRRSEPGYPDIHAIHPGRKQEFYAELKMGKRQPTEAQRSWIVALVELNHPVFVWYPRDWGDIVDLATGRLDP